MQKARFVLQSVGVVILSMILPPSSATANDLAWPAIGREQRPWAYNWWLGSAVDKENLAKELRRHRDAGLGGVHIVPIYGAKNADARYIPYLSPQWMEMLAFTVEEARRLDLGIDMTTGTGWCFGGPNVPPEHGGLSVVTRTLSLPTAGALDPRGKTHWETLIARSADGQRVDVTNKLSPDGRLDWKPRDAGWTLYALGQQPTNLAVKRSAPGGAGLMLNPLYDEAMKHYLERFTRAFAAKDVVQPRAMYHDSYEYYNCQWSPALLDEFARRRGYRLQDQLEAFVGSGPQDVIARVKCDYRETISDLMALRVFPVWTAWCRQRGMLTRYQAHGSPANLLDLYALADIPETEMFGHGGENPLVSHFDADLGRLSKTCSRDPLVSKFASSAAHLAGRKLVASETGTWLAEHFCETLEEMKCLVDLMFVSGINHVFYHGCVYSPEDAPWPGWLFYASTQMNPRNSIWHDVPALNAYIARCQAVLQSGQPDNDILLYWPIHDFWHDSQDILTQLGVHDPRWLDKQAIGATAGVLWKRGYGFDYVSDRILEKVRTESGGIVAGETRYRVVVVPPTVHMPVDTLRKLLELATGGATVIFQQRLPQDVPGLGGMEDRRVQMKTLLRSVLLAPSPDKDVQVAELGRGRVLVGGLPAALVLVGVQPELFAQQENVMFVRRRHDEGRHYFVVNHNLKSLDGWYAPATTTRSAVVMDPLTGNAAVAPTRQGKNQRTEVYLHLEPGHSLILRTFENRQAQGVVSPILKPGERVLEIPGPWKLDFVAGGPALPTPCETTKLDSWTTNGDPATVSFAGTAVYRTSFDLPDSARGHERLYLDLGRVCNSARVRLNGRHQSTLIMTPFRLLLEGLKPTGNLLEIEVTNLSANRIRDLDQHKVVWKVFNEINFVSIRYRPFDASQWPVFDSGLLGPVTLWTVRR